MNLAELPRIGLLAGAFLLAYYPLVAPLTSPELFYAAVLACAFAASGVGYLASIVFVDASRAQLATTATVLACAMFSGILPTLDDLEGMSPALSTTAWASPNRWLCEALYVLQVRRGPVLA